MSSWKKAGKTNQKTHRERHQPESRKHLGLLEKKKDYQARAKNQNEKQDTLKLLRKRALNRNPDEFYHHMINSKVHDGEHHEKEEKDEHTPDQIKLMQTQDIKYITMKRTIESNKIKRLQSELHMIDAVNQIPNKHTFFVDTEEEARIFDVAKHLDTHPLLLDRRTNRPKLKELETIGMDAVDDATLKTLKINREVAYKELNKRIEREKQLGVIYDKMLLKRTLQQSRNLKPVRVVKGTKEAAPIYKFKYERKK